MPSYTDRILFKNNTAMEIIDNEYCALDQTTGSDHRPVKLSFSIKDFFTHTFDHTPCHASIIFDSMQLGNLNHELLVEMLPTFTDYAIKIRACFIAPWIDYDNQNMVFASTPLLNNIRHAIDFSEFPEELSVAIRDMEDLAK